MPSRRAITVWSDGDSFKHSPVMHERQRIHLSVLKPQANVRCEWRGGGERADPWGPGGLRVPHQAPERTLPGHAE
eukprot:scaffold318600_cov15-Prasinocladus_malaysianus.AAC.1